MCQARGSRKASGSRWTDGAEQVAHKGREGVDGSRPRSWVRGLREGWTAWHACGDTPHHRHRAAHGAHVHAALCHWHHRDGGEDWPAVHPFRKRFEAKYGTQLELLAALKKRLGVFDEARYEA